MSEAKRPPLGGIIPYDSRYPPPRLAPDRDDMTEALVRIARLETLVRWLTQREIAAANRAHTDLSERVEIAKVLEGLG